MNRIYIAVCTVRVYCSASAFQHHIVQYRSMRCGRWTMPEWKMRQHIWQGRKIQE